MPSHAPKTVRQCEQRITILRRKQRAAIANGDTFEAERYGLHIDHLLDVRAALAHADQQRRDWLGLDWSGRAK